MDFIGQVINHEIVHYGAQTHDMSPTVDPYQGNPTGERGQYFTDMAYGRTISWDRPEAGIAIFTTFITFATGGCPVEPNRCEFRDNKSLPPDYTDKVKDNAIKGFVNRLNSQ